MTKRGRTTGGWWKWALVGGWIALGSAALPGTARAAYERDHVLGFKLEALVLVDHPEGVRSAVTMGGYGWLTIKWDIWIGYIDIAVGIGWDRGGLAMPLDLGLDFFVLRDPVRLYLGGGIVPTYYVAAPGDAAIDAYAQFGVMFDVGTMTEMWFDLRMAERFFDTNVACVGSACNQARLIGTSMHLFYGVGW